MAYKLENKYKTMLKNFIKKNRFKLKKILNRDLKNELNKNLDLKNKHLDQRCFIVGNGPSLKNQNLTLIKDEFVFTVNQLMRSDYFFKMAPDYHFIVDSKFFSLNPNKPEEKERIEMLYELGNISKLTCCFPYNAKGFIEDLGLDDKLKIRYIYSNVDIHDSYNSDFDLTKGIPGPQTVIHSAIYTAIYMGFKKIYLLGCDMTGLLQKYTSEENSLEQYGHVYSYSNKERKYIKDEMESRSNELMLNAFSNMFYIYRMIFRYAQENDIKIINLTDGGALDVFPRENYNTIVESENK